MRKIIVAIKENYASMGFRYKLMLFCVGVVIIPVLLITAFYTNQLANTLEEQSVSNAKYELSQVQSTIESNIALVEELSNQYYFNNTLNKELLRIYQNKGDSAAVYVDIIRPQLKDIQYLHRQLIDSIKIYIHNETFLADCSNIIYISEDIRSQHWYQQCMKKRQQSEKLWFYGYNDEGAAVYSLYRNLNNYLGESAGILRIDVDAGYFDTIARRDGQDFWILLEENRGDGVLLSPSQPELPDYMADVLKNEAGQYDIVHNAEKHKVIYSSFSSGYSAFRWKVVSVIPLEALLHDVIVAKQSVLFIGIAASLLLMGMIIVYANGMTRRINHLAEQTGSVMRGSFDKKVDVEGRDEIGQLGESFNEMLSYLDNLVNEVYENTIKIQDYQLKQKESELKALQNKINPHFLYNTLDAIRFRAVIAGNEELAEMMVSLSQLLSYSINNKSDIVTLKQELEHVKSYITLMKVRYEDRLHFTINADEDLYNCQVNKLMLQPLVENAIYHGIRPLNRAGHISITTLHQGDTLKILIEDDGKGMSPKKLLKVNRFEESDEDKGKVSIGLGNVHNRIKLFFGEAYGIKIESEEGMGTTIVITLPYKQKGEDHV